MLQAVRISASFLHAPPWTNPSFQGFFTSGCKSLAVLGGVKNKTKQKSVETNPKGSEGMGDGNPRAPPSHRAVFAALAAPWNSQLHPGPAYSRCNSSVPFSLSASPPPEFLRVIPPPRPPFECPWLHPPSGGELQPGNESGFQQEL